MSKLQRRALAVAAAAVMGIGSLASGPANADKIQLGFVLDASGSITNSEWTIITQGLSNAIGLIPTSGSDQYYLSLAIFGWNSQTIINNSLITGGNIGSFQTQIAGLTRSGINTGATNYEAAFTQMASAMGSTVGYDASYVNFATDGEPNVCTSSAWGSDYWGCGVAARNTLLAAGVDNISIEGIGITSGAATSLKTKICAPQPCDDTQPYNFPTQGFYIGVANATQYAEAIKHKIRVVTGQIPEPASIALVGLALMGIGAARGRKARA